MSQLTSDPQAAGQALFTSSATPYHALGEKLVTADGRIFRYCQAGAGANLVAGNFVQSAAQIGNHQNLTPANAAIGDTTLSVTLGGTAATANQYAGGYAIVTITPGLGQCLAISGNPAQATTNGVLVLQLSEPIRVALTAANSKVDLVPNAYKGLIQNPVTTLTGACVGVAPYVITASEYGWVQRSGMAAALVDGSSPAVGTVLSVPGSAAGAAVADPANAAVMLVGVVAATGATGETNAVMLSFE